MITIERADDVAKFLLEKRLPGHVFAPPFAGFVVIRNGLPLGAYILNCWTGHDIDLSATIFAPWPICVAREIARQCFVSMRVSRITARTRVSNKEAMRSLMACGFVCENIARDHFGDEDAMVFALLRRDQKLLRTL